MERGDVDPIALDRYFAGDASPAERVVVARWLDGAPGRRAYYEAVHGGAVPRRALSAEQVEHARSRVLDRAKHVSGPGTSEQKRRGALGPALPRATNFASRALKIWLGFGAVLTVIGVVGVRCRCVYPRAALQTYTTAAGRSARFTLPDGSRLVLAPESRLSIDPEFGTATRSVTLAGEAYFDVSPSPHAPFMVHTAKTATQVLGTAFDVRYYPTDTAVSIAVLSGRVRTTSRGAAATIVAGSIAQITDSLAVTNQGDVRAYTDWTAGTLVFDKIPASVMLATIGRWYGYTFQLTDSTLATRRVVAAFNVKQSTETLRAIQQLLDVTMTFRGTTVLLEPRSASHSMPVRQEERTLNRIPTEIGK